MCREAPVLGRERPWNGDRSSAIPGCETSPWHDRPGDADKLSLVIAARTSAANQTRFC